MPYIVPRNKETSKNDSLKTLFLRELEHNNCKDTIAPQLAKIIKQYILCNKRNRSGNIGFWSLNLSEEASVVMLHFTSDKVLIKLANECGFPRGFPIIWFLSKYIYIYMVSGQNLVMTKDNRTIQTNSAYQKN